MLHHKDAPHVQHPRKAVAGRAADRHSDDENNGTGRSDGQAEEGLQDENNGNAGDASGDDEGIEGRGDGDANSSNEIPPKYAKTVARRLASITACFLLPRIDAETLPNIILVPASGDHATVEDIALSNLARGYKAVATEELVRFKYTRVLSPTS